MIKHVAIICLLVISTLKVRGQIDLLRIEQQQMVGQLSGKFALENGSFLKSRDTPSARAVARQYLAKQIEDIGLKPKRQSYRMPNLNPLIDMLFSPFKGANVYTVIPASRKSDNYVVLGAHFDTELDCPGAIDNATGSTLIFSVGKMLYALEERKMNVIIVFFDQEEEELIGSQAFAKFLKAENFNVHSVHTFDMVGWDEDGNKEMELELPTPDLENAYQTKALELGIPLYVTSINSTDHHSFRQVGFQAIGINEAYGKRDSTPYKDTPEDTYETVNFDYLAESTMFVYAVIKEIINGGD
ncbi:M28 family peptidase [Ekhidna sp.]|uniref:M28 family metallopeptidase n=1 Tax=Ekhidna sp. TaxID=2608089 RepID=UPI003299E529